MPRISTENSEPWADLSSGRYASPIAFFNVGEWVPLVTTPVGALHDRAQIRAYYEMLFASLEGARAAIVHLYNAVSPAWREIVFRMSRDEVRAIAVGMHD